MVSGVEDLRRSATKRTTTARRQAELSAKGVGHSFLSGTDEDIARRIADRVRCRGRGLRRLEGNSKLVVGEKRYGS